MKKLLTALLTVFMALVLIGDASARSRAIVYNLFLTTTESGSTTTASGTSAMIVEGEGIDRSQGLTTISQLDKVSGEAWAAQLYGITTITAATSGATFGLYYRESFFSDTSSWAASSSTPIFSNIALSGDTRAIYTFDPIGLGDIQFRFVTGTSPITGVSIQVRVMNKE